MLTSIVIDIITFLIGILPFSIPSLPENVLSIINQVNDLFISALSIIKSILPWSYLVILLKLVLIVELGIFTYKYCKIIIKFFIYIIDKIIDIIKEVISKLGALIKRLIAMI